MAWLTLIGALLAPFVFVQFIESILPPATRTAIAEYVFGYNAPDVSDYERNVIRAVLSPFIVDSRIRPLRVLAFTAAYSAIIVLCMSAIYNRPDMGLMPPHYALWAMTVLVGALVDISAFWLLKRMMLDTRLFDWPMSIFAVVLQTVATGAIFGVIAFAGISLLHAAGLGPTADDLLISGWQAMLLLGLGISLSVSAAINVLLVLLVFSGIAVRLSVRATGVTQWLSQRTSVHNYPLSFLYLLLAAVGAVALIALGVS